MGIYSVQDYILYLAILFGILLFLLRVLFRRIDIDKKFLILISPYIVLGILIRLLADVGFFEKSQYWSITPGVYLVTIFLALIFIYIGFLFEKYLGIEYRIVPFSVCIIIDLFLAYNLLHHIVKPDRILYPVLIAILITILVFIISKISGQKILYKTENISIIFAHLLDGSATFLAYNYFKFDEEHLLPRYLISIAGNNAVIMIPLKLTVVVLVLYMLEGWYINEKNDLKQPKALYALIKILIFVVGFGPGVRDTILPSLLAV